MSETQTTQSGDYPLPRQPRLWLTADLHLGHANIIKYSHRPFLNASETQQLQEAEKIEDPVAQRSAIREVRVSREAVAHHDSTIINNINELVGDQDRLVIIGDFCWARTRKDTENYLARILCPNVQFIWGNHDDDWTGHVFEAMKRGHRPSNLYEDKIDGVPVTMCHYPMLTWNHSHHGGLMLHGHDHGHIEEFKRKHMPHVPVIDVGVDCWNYKPVSWEDLNRLANARKAMAVDPENRVLRFKSGVSRHGL